MRCGIVFPHTPYPLPHTIYIFLPPTTFHHSSWVKNLVIFTVIAIPRSGRSNLIIFSCVLYLPTSDFGLRTSDFFSNTKYFRSGIGKAYKKQCINTNAMMIFRQKKRPFRPVFVNAAPCSERAKYE